MATIMKRPDGRVRKLVSLLPDQEGALVFLAFEEGHGVMSRTIQSLIDQEMRRKFGENWRPEIRKWLSEQQELMAG